MNLTTPFNDEKTFIGPHVLTKTGEKTKVYSTVHGFRGEIDIWECKYCGNTGTLPDEPGISTAWKEDCGDMKVAASEEDRIETIVEHEGKLSQTIENREDSGMFRDIYGDNKLLWSIKVILLIIAVIYTLLYLL